jgi:hypothetical protein
VLGELDEVDALGAAELLGVHVEHRLRVRLPELAERPERLVEPLAVPRPPLVHRHHAHHERVGGDAQQLARRERATIGQRHRRSRAVDPRVHAQRHVHGVEAGVEQETLTEPRHGDRRRARAVEELDDVGGHREVVDRRPRRHLEVGEHRVLQRPHVEAGDDPAGLRVALEHVLRVAVHHVVPVDFVPTGKDRYRGLRGRHDPSARPALLPVGGRDRHLVAGAHQALGQLGDLHAVARLHVGCISVQQEPRHFAPAVITSVESSTAACSW